MNRRDFFKQSSVFALGALATGSALAQNKAEERREKKDARMEGHIAGDWTPLFNGKDLSGWKPDGKAVWTVEDGCIVGVQGPGAAPGDLFTEKEFGDFELRVVYKVQWPANTGVWFRYQSPEKSYQFDILEYKNPEAYSGSIYCPGKVFIATNLNKTLEKHDDWNTALISAVGDRLVVSLNGVETGNVQEASFATGKVGFQVHPGDEFKTMKVIVREVSLRPVSAKAEHAATPAATNTPNRFRSRNAVKKQ